MHKPLPKSFDETPDAGDEWTAKALLLGAELEVDSSVWGTLWRARVPGVNGAVCFGVTQARACRKLVRYITGVE